MIDIQPLTSESLQRACAVANNVFKSREVPPSRALEASLDDKKRQVFKTQLFEEHAIRMVDFNYWVALDLKSEEIVGVIGLYSSEEDIETSLWISWFCVCNSARGKGVGSQLLQNVINLAQDQNKKFLRLFTSTDPNEASAQRLYEKLGFRVMTERHRKKRGNYEIFYRQLKLNQ